MSVELTGSWSIPQELWARAPQICQDELFAAVTEADLLIEREVKDATPTATSIGRDSIVPHEERIPEGALGVVGSPLQYMVYVELGTKPHFPPLQPLEDWVKVKFGLDDKQAESAAYLIARKIAAQGTKGAHMFEQAFNRLLPQIEQIFIQARERIAARLAGA